MLPAVFDKKSINKLETDDPYLLKAREVCRQWLQGQAFFSLSTSGSTGTPKKIIVSRGQLTASVYTTKQALGLAGNIRALACLSVDYVAGFMMLIRAMELGWTVTLVSPVSNPLLEVDSVFDFSALVPMQLSAILADEKTRSRVNSLGKILLGGAGLSAAQQEAFQLKGQEVYHGYGMTETVSHVALRRLGGIGSENKYFVTGETEFGADERGCLFFKGAVTGNQIVQTNDLATILPHERAFILHGRLDNTVNSGGIKIQLETMESELGIIFNANGLDFRFFLWKVPDDRLGESLVMVVEGPAGMKEKISALIKQNIERLKRPRALFFTPAFVLNQGNKVDKIRTFENLTNKS